MALLWPLMAPLLVSVLMLPKSRMPAVLLLMMVPLLFNVATLAEPAIDTAAALVPLALTRPTLTSVVFTPVTATPTTDLAVALMVPPLPIEPVLDDSAQGPATLLVTGQAHDALAGSTGTMTIAPARAESIARLETPASRRLRACAPRVTMTLLGSSLLMTGPLTLILSFELGVWNLPGAHPPW